MNVIKITTVCSVIVIALMITAGNTHAARGYDADVKRLCDKETRIKYYKYGTPRYKVDRNASALCQMEVKRIHTQQRIDQSYIDVNNAFADWLYDNTRPYNRRKR